MALCFVCTVYNTIHFLPTFKPTRCYQFSELAPKSLVMPLKRNLLYRFVEDNCHNRMAHYYSIGKLDSLTYGLKIRSYVIHYTPCPARILEANSKHKNTDIARVSTTLSGLTRNWLSVCVCVVILII
jgi:hypothetical protein